MSDLVTFVLAQLDADEAAARAAEDSGVWEVRPYTESGVEGEVYVVGVDTPNEVYNAVCGAEYEGYHSTVAPGNAAHIARHDPARVLAEVAAKRAIVEIHEGYEGYGGLWWCNQCADGAYGDRANWPCQTLRALASVYEGAPGWQEEWR